MEAREYLLQIERNERLIKNKQFERDFWLGLATSTTTTLGGDRVQSSSNKQAMESQAIEAAEADREIRRLKQEIADIIHTIQQLEVDEYDFLHKHYVQHKAVKAIASEKKLSNSWATATHKKALDHLQAILDEKEKGAGN